MSACGNSELLIEDRVGYHKPQPPDKHAEAIGTFRMEQSPSTAIGLMSGTSMDGVDAALIRTDGDRHVETGPSLTVPYKPEFRQRLRAILGGRGDVDAVERELTQAHAEAVQRLLDTAGLVADQVDLIGFHGQTILHAPHERRTWQIGDGAALAAAVGIDVVNDFRSADVAEGGQGAPLLPLYHRALSADLGKPVIVLNLGGVGNLTWIGRDGDIVAFDTGPGNALLDDWMLAKSGVAFDRDGATSARGKVDPERLNRLLDHPYFGRPGPKSLDRNDFGFDPVDAMSLEDGAATLAAFTVETVAMAIGLLPEPPRRCVVTGGGRHNRTIMAGLRNELGIPVDPVEVVGWQGDALEAQGFAYLAVRSRLGLPLSLPTTTGVPAPLTGGAYHPAPLREDAWQAVAAELRR